MEFVILNQYPEEGKPASGEIITINKIIEQLKANLDHVFHHPLAGAQDGTGKALLIQTEIWCRDISELPPEYVPFYTPEP